MSSLPQSPPERLHALDALRALALLLGLVVHASMAFLPGAQYFWLAHDPAPSTPLTLAFYVPHMFRMLLFFLLAGFFGRLARQRLGTAAFLRDRGKRIVSVLLAAWPLVFAAIVAVAVFAAWWQGGGQLPKEAPPGPRFSADDFPLTHLWFLYALTLCYAAMLVLRAIIVRWDPRQWLARAADAVTARLTSPIGPLLLAAPLAAALYFGPAWFAWFGIPTPDRALYPGVAAAIAFGGAFVFGWWLQRQPQGLHRWQQQWPWHLAIALAATIACLALIGIDPVLAPAGRDARSLAYAGLYTWAGWSWVAALTGIALRYLSAPRAWLRYLADASYWIYLIHLPLVMLLQVVASHLPGPAVLKFAAVLATTLIVCLGSYHVCVRGRWIGAWINGRRKPRASAAAAHAIG